MDNLLFSANIVAPIFLLIALGYLLTCVKAWDAGFLKIANSLSFKLFFPVLLFYNISHADFYEIFDFRFLLFLILFISAVVALSLLIVPFTVKNNRRRGVIIQALFRGNFLLLGLPLCQGMFGDAGAAAASVTAAIVVPYFNVLATILLSVYGGEKIERPVLVIAKILKNPLILGSALGVVSTLLGIEYPYIIDKTILSVRELATPFALMILGGDFRFRSFVRNFAVVSLTGVLRLVIIPAAALAMFFIIGYSGLEMGVIISVFCTPVAVSSYVMAYEMDCDYELAGRLLCLPRDFRCNHIPEHILLPHVRYI